LKNADICYLFYLFHFSYRVRKVKNVRWKRELHRSQRLVLFVFEGHYWLCYVLNDMEFINEVSDPYIMKIMKELDD